jgi:hypothetical protein
MVDVEATLRSFVKLVNEDVITPKQTSEEVMSLF